MIAVIENVLDPDVKPSLLNTGIGKPDQLILPVGTTSVLGAGTGVGKTAFTIALMLGAMLNNPEGHGLLLVWEDSAYTAAVRVIAALSRIDGMLVHQHRVDAEQRRDLDALRKALREKSDRRAEAVSRIRVVHANSKTIDWAEREVRAHAHRYNVKMLALDYVQRVYVPGGYNRDGQIEQVINKFDALISRQHGIDAAGLICSQLNREGQSKEAPSMNDLRNSGTIENVAKYIMLLHENEHGLAEVNVRKNSEGPTGLPRRFRFHKQWQIFEAIAPSTRQGPYD